MLDAGDNLTVVAGEQGDFSYPGVPVLEQGHDQLPHAASYDSIAAGIQEEAMAGPQEGERLDFERFSRLTVEEDPSSLGLETANRVSRVTTPLLISAGEIAPAASPSPSHGGEDPGLDYFTDLHEELAETPEMGHFLPPRLRGSTTRFFSPPWGEYLKGHSEVRSNLKGHRGLNSSKLARRPAPAPALLLKEVPSVAALAEGEKTHLNPVKQARFDRFLEKIERAKSLHDTYKLVQKTLHFLENELSRSPIQQARYIGKIVDRVTFGPLNLLPGPQDRLQDDMDFQLGSFCERTSLRFAYAQRNFWDQRLGYGRRLMETIEEMRLEIEILKRQEAYLLPEAALHTPAADFATSLGLESLKAVYTPYRQKVNFLRGELQTMTVTEILNAIDLVPPPKERWAVSPAEASAHPADSSCILEFNIGPVETVRYVIESVRDKETRTNKLSLRPYLEAESPSMPKSRYYQQKASNLDLFCDPSFS